MKHAGRASPRSPVLPAGPIRAWPSNWRSTFERPAHLRRCLVALDVQRGVAGRFEVVVTDDGSRDGTTRLVSALAGSVSYPLSFTTHDHAGFRLARCRNEGAAASTAPYILFTDGDCVLPPDHLRIHLEERRPGWIVAGDCFRLDPAVSKRLDARSIREGGSGAFVPRGERRRIAVKALRAKVYQMLRVPLRPRVSGSNMALWRSDFERVNGFDERFVGWGLEDVDLQWRLARAGVRSRTILHRTAAIHLWHEPAATFVRNGIGTANRWYVDDPTRPTFCRDGLVKPDDAARVVPLSLPAAFRERRRIAA